MAITLRAPSMTLSSTRACEKGKAASRLSTIHAVSPSLSGCISSMLHRSVGQGTTGCCGNRQHRKALVPSFSSSIPAQVRFSSSKSQGSESASKKSELSPPADDLYLRTSLFDMICSISKNNLLIPH